MHQHFWVNMREEKGKKPPVTFKTVVGKANISVIICLTVICLMGWIYCFP